MVSKTKLYVVSSWFLRNPLLCSFFHNLIQWRGIINSPACENSGILSREPSQSRRLEYHCSLVLTCYKGRTDLEKVPDLSKVCWWKELLFLCCAWETWGDSRFWTATAVSLPYESVSIIFSWEQKHFHLLKLLNKWIAFSCSISMLFCAETSFFPSVLPSDKEASPIKCSVTSFLQMSVIIIIIFLN